MVERKTKEASEHFEGGLIMALFLSDKEVTLEELKHALDNLDYGPPDGGTFEVLELYDIKDGNMYFEITIHSLF